MTGRPPRRWKTSRSFRWAPPPVEHDTKAAFDKVKAKGNVRMWRPSDAPFEIPGANARIYALGPPHDPKLIRKINPSTTNPETYGLVDERQGRTAFGSHRGAGTGSIADGEDAEGQERAPFHPGMTIPLGPNGRPSLFDNAWIDDVAWRESTISSGTTTLPAPTGDVSTANGSAPRRNLRSRCKATPTIRVPC